MTKQNQTANEPNRFLGLFSITMISVSAIIALRNLPTMAFHGFSSAFFYLAAALFFFIPIALVVGELTSGWPKKGGVYAWVAEAFGNPTGALAIWLEWIESVVWLPTVLSFIAGTFAYIISPELATDKYFLLGTMMFFLWTGTFLNFRDMHTSSWVSSVGIIMGSLIPGILIIGLGAYWLLAGHSSHIELNMQTFFPEFKFSTLVFFTGVILGFAGIEVAAYHVQETKNPQRTFPIAAFMTAFIIIAIYVLGTLAIALIVPKEELSLTSGLMQAFHGFFKALNLEWAIKAIGIMGMVGALALLNTWIIGPSKGLLASCLNGDFPKITTKVNRAGSPIVILLGQAVTATLLATLFIVLPTVNAGYWVLNVMAGQLISLMYFFVFIAVIKLRYSQPDTVRLYKVPGGKVGIWIIAGSGAIASLAAFFMGFVPPDEFDFGDTRHYELLLAVGILILSSPPLLYQLYRRTRRQKTLIQDTV